MGQADDQLGGREKAEEAVPAERPRKTGEGDSGLGGAPGDGGAGGISGVREDPTGGPATTGETRQ